VYSVHAEKIPSTKRHLSVLASPTVPALHQSSIGHGLRNAFGWATHVKIVFSASLSQEPT
jgi:hypothetical protein